MAAAGGEQLVNAIDVVWTDQELVTQSAGTPVSIVQLWDSHAEVVKSLDTNVVKMILQTGKKTRDVLKAKAARENVSCVRIGQLLLNFSKDLGPTELNFQRLAALVAFWNSTKAPAQRVAPAMGSCIPTPTDAGFAKFQAMMAPGYAFLGRGLFATSGALLPGEMGPGDRARYMAGAVMLDWVQAVRVGDEKGLTLKKFYRERGWNKVMGTVKQLVCNNSGDGGMVYTLTQEEMRVFKALLDRDVLIMAGAAIRERVRVATAGWV